MNAVHSITELIDAFERGGLGSRELGARLGAIAAQTTDNALLVRSAVQRARLAGTLAGAALADVESHLGELDTDPRTRLKAPSEPAETGTRLKVRSDPAPEGTRLRRAVEGAANDRSGMPGPGPSATDSTPRGARRLESGALIKERFLLLEQIGQGGMGVVYKARDQEYHGHEQHVALKFLSGALQGRPEALQALEEEVRKTHELAHPNIVTVYDFYRDAPFHFISMEFLEGDPLDRLIRRHPSGLPFNTAWTIIKGVGTALDYAHEQDIIHSDFKPGNVFLTRDDRVKVLDFGIARAARVDADEYETGTNRLLGLTIAYASPEMVLSLEPDPRDDVYALACVAYELLSGRHPFDRQPAHRAQHAGMAVPAITGLSRARMRALRRGLAFTRDARTGSVAEFIDELRAAPRRGKLVQTGSIATLGVLALAAGGAFVYSSGQRCAQIDADFLRALQPVAQESIDPGYRDVLIEQGEDYLNSARAEFSPTLLSEGVSDAFGAFRSVLRIDPENSAALAGIMEVIGLYEAEARRLLGLGQARESLAVAEYGLKVHSLHCGLNDVRERAAALID